jgi:exodeoxyribonuclease VII small subunit
VVKAKLSTDLGTAEPTVVDAPLSFEATIGELGQIVEQLERGDLPLEQSLDLFERGMRLSKDAQARLDVAEKRVEVLLGFDETAQPITRELDPDSSR